LGNNILATLYAAANRQPKPSNPSRDVSLLPELVQESTATLGHIRQRDVALRVKPSRGQRGLDVWVSTRSKSHKPEADAGLVLAGILVALALLIVAAPFVTMRFGGGEGALGPEPSCGLPKTLERHMATVAWIMSDGEWRALQDSNLRPPGS